MVSLIPPVAFARESCALTVSCVVCDLSRLGYTCRMGSVCLRLCTVCFNPLSTLREVPKWRFFVKILRIGVNELRHNNKNVIFRLP